MKRIRPTALIAVRSDEYRLRCRPDFDRITAAEYANVMISFKARCVDETASDKNVESEFVFSVNDRGGVEQDDYFFRITGDDYGEMWINKSITSFWLAARNGVGIPGGADDDTADLSLASPAGADVSDTTKGKLYPNKLVVDSSNDLKTRRYTVLFSNKTGGEHQDIFTVVGSGDARTISWVHGTHDAIWSERNWSFVEPNPGESLTPLLIAILRMDEAINLELMPYAMS